MLFKELKIGARFTINFLNDGKTYTKINTEPFHHANARFRKEMISVHANTRVKEINNGNIHIKAKKKRKKSY